MQTKTKTEALLRIFSDVRAGEGRRVLAMLGSLLSLMIAYYVLKTIREPLILASGGAEVKSYAAGAQAALLVGFVPAYAWLTRRVGRRGLILTLVGFFLANMELFSLALHLGVRWVGVAFFVWVGIFSLSVIAQFWSLTNDLYSQEEGERLFPVIALGATLGSPIGARVASSLFSRGLSPGSMLQIAAALLVVHGASALWLARSTTRAAERPMEAGPNGLWLVLKSPYLRLVALLLVLLNLVNTVGEYVLGKSVVAAAHAAVTAGHAASVSAYIGAFYGDFFFWVNVAAALIQALLVSRVVKRFGVRGVLLFLPMVSLGLYAGIAAGAGFVFVRWLKTLENAADYSVMNTGRALMWLPTTREEKYRAKQAIDTFFVRFGDVLSALLVAVAVRWLHVPPSRLAAINVALALAWIAVASTVAYFHARLAGAPVRAEEAAPKTSDATAPFGAQLEAA